MTLRSALTFAVAVPALWAGSARAAPILDVYAIAAAGQSILGAVGGGFSCSTFAPDPRSFRYTGGGAYLVSLPTDGPGCGVMADIRSQTGSTAPQALSSTVNVSFGTPGDPRSYTGSAGARAAYGELGVRSDGSYSGTVDSFVVDGSGAGALQTEVFTFGGASGAGTFRPTFTLDGSLFTQGRTDNQIVFSYGVGGLTYTTFRIQDSRGDLTFLTPTGYVASLPGMTVSGNNAIGQLVSGSTTFQFDMPIVFGAPLEASFSLWAGTLPSSSVGQAFPSNGSSSFYSSVRLTGIELFDGSGQPVPGFTVVSGSGTVYSAAGVVPEPGTAVLMSLGVAALCLKVRRAGVVRP